MPTYVVPGGMPVKGNPSLDKIEHNAPEQSAGVDNWMIHETRASRPRFSPET
jgi:hypothetical protein